MTATSSSNITVALIHGAFADSSGWSGVAEKLLATGVDVTTIPNPLRGIEEDSAYVASVLAQIPGPVLAVGHSYGGAVITNAASKTDNVKGLVYVAAFAPDEGERLMDIEAGSKDSVLNSVLQNNDYPTAHGTETEFRIDPAAFHDAFAADVSPEQAALMARTQRPVSALAFSQPNGEPAWKKLPSWAVVATGDKAAGTDVVRSMAQRANATITDAEGSHVIMVTRPDIVAEVVTSALTSLQKSTQ